MGVLRNWFCSDKEEVLRQLTDKMELKLDAVSSEQVAIFVPTLVLWEISMMVDGRDIEFDRPFTEWVDQLFRYPTVNPLPFDEETVKVFHDIRYHTDPFDRAIVATAIHVDLPLITNDGMMHEHSPCRLYWD